MCLHLKRYAINCNVLETVEFIESKWGKKIPNFFFFLNECILRALTAIKQVVDIPAITDASVFNAVQNYYLCIKISIIKRPRSHHK